MDARVPIFAATAVDIGRVASHTLGHLYPQDSPGTQFSEWAPEAKWTRRTEENLHQYAAWDQNRAVQQVVDFLAA